MHTTTSFRNRRLIYALLLILLLLLFVTRTTPSAITLHAGAITTIPGPGGWGFSTYTCTFAEDCATSASGSSHIVDFSQMFTTAGSNHAMPAVLYIEGLRIQVPVYIALTGNEPSVVATFVKPYGTVTSKSAFLIRGVFGVNTVITIDGGIFTMSGIASQYFYVNNPLTLLGSSIIIKNVVTYNSMGILGFNEITIRNGGSVQLYDNSILLSTSTTIVPSYRSVFSSSGLTLAESSNVTAHNNTISFVVYEPKTPKVAMMLLSGSVTMMSGSQLVATSNYYNMEGMTDSTQIQLFCAAFEGAVSLTNSSIDIQSNLMNMKSVYIGYLQFTYMMMSSTTTLVDHSSIILFSNVANIAVGLSTSGSTYSQLAIFQYAISMNQSCIVSISQNNLAATFEGASQVLEIYIVKLNTLFLNTSQFLVHSNQLSTTTPTEAVFFFAVVAFAQSVYADGTLLSKFEVTENLLTVAVNSSSVQPKTFILAITGVLDALAKNAILIARNTYTVAPNTFAANTNVIFLGSSATPGSIVTVCTNTINGVLYNKVKKTSMVAPPPTILVCNPTKTIVYRTPTCCCGGWWSR